jgi:hypothetical protein
LPKEGRLVRKVAVLLGGLLAVGAPLSAHALASQGAPRVDGTCITVPVADQTICIPPDGLPGVPSLPPVPQPALPPLPAPPDLPPPPQLPPPPDLPPLPSVPLPPIPSLPSAPTQTASVGAASTGPLCNYDPARPNPAPAGEQSVTLPDGTTIFGYYNVDAATMTATGYLGGTNPTVGTLEGGGTASPSGATGQIDGNNVQTGASGYAGSNGACLGK